MKLILEKGFSRNTDILRKLPLFSFLSEGFMNSSDQANQKLNILTKDHKKYDLEGQIVKKSVLLSQLLAYPSNGEDLIIPFDLSTILIAEKFAKLDNITKDHTQNQMNIFSEEMYKPLNVEHLKISADLKNVVKELEIEELTEVIKLGNYLNYNLLLECGCFHLADHMSAVSTTEELFEL